VSHRTHCVTRVRVNEQPESAPCYAMASPQWAVRLSCYLKFGQPVGAVPTALLDDEHDLRDGLPRLRQAPGGWIPMGFGARG
jgi:hypothetical protein